MKNLILSGIFLIFSIAHSDDYTGGSGVRPGESVSEALIRVQNAPKKKQVRNPYFVFSHIIENPERPAHNVEYCALLPYVIRSQESGGMEYVLDTQKAGIIKSKSADFVYMDSHIKGLIGFPDKPKGKEVSLDELKAHFLKNYPEVEGIQKLDSIVFLIPQLTTLMLQADPIPNRPKTNLAYEPGSQPDSDISEWRRALSSRNILEKRLLDFPLKAQSDPTESWKNLSRNSLLAELALLSFVEEWCLR